MKIQNINSLNYIQRNNVKNSSSNPVSKPNYDAVSFCGYQQTLEKYAKQKFINVPEVKLAFTDIFEALDKDKTIVKNEDFQTLKNNFSEYGVVGLLRKMLLSKYKDGNSLTKFVPEYEEARKVLATVDNKPVILIENNGKFNFLDIFKDSKQTPDKIVLRFQDPQDVNAVSFCLNKDHCFEFSQENYNRSTDYKFYTNGTLKKVIDFIGSSPADVTYYKKDGTKSFFKNWFLTGHGDTPIW